MCGRYASSRRPDELTGFFDLTEPVEEELPPSYNVAPTDPAYAIVCRHGRRTAEVVQWGLVPSWAKDAKGAARLINARVETLADKPAFRSAYQRRRCLLPADGYYEWEPVAGGKQPWFITTRDATPLAMAGLYEIWRDPEGSLLWTATVITTAAADDLGRIHDRAPMLVPPQGWSRWLDPDVTHPGELLVPGVAGLLVAWPVDPAVGNVRNNSPDLVQPITPPPASLGQLDDANGRN